MSLSHTELAVLCELKDFGTVTEADLAYAVPGARAVLSGLCSEGYIEVLEVAERQAGWRLTDGGLDVVDGNC